MGVKLHEVKTREGDHYAWLFRCPGCHEPHQCDSRWTWNGSIEEPTFGEGQEKPSVLVECKYGEDQRATRCHSFVRNGKIQFLGDCTHALAGQTVDLPDWDR